MFPLYKSPISHKTYDKKIPKYKLELLFQDSESVLCVGKGSILPEYATQVGYVSLVFINSIVTFLCVSVGCQLYVT